MMVFRIGFEDGAVSLERKLCITFGGLNQKALWIFAELRKKFMISI